MTSAQATGIEYSSAIKTGSGTSTSSLKGSGTKYIKIKEDNLNDNSEYTPNGMSISMWPTKSTPSQGHGMSRRMPSLSVSKLISTCKKKSDLVERELKNNREMARERMQRVEDAVVVPQLPPL